MDEPTSYGDALSRYSSTLKSEIRIEDVMPSREHGPPSHYIVRQTERNTNNSETAPSHLPS